MSCCLLITMDSLCACHPKKSHFIASYHNHTWHSKATEKKNNHGTTPDNPEETDFELTILVSMKSSGDIQNNTVFIVKRLLILDSNSQQTTKEVYRPVIIELNRGHGVTDADVAEVT